MKSISVRLSDYDLAMLDFLFDRYYGPDLSQCENLNLPYSPVLRSCIGLAYEVLFNNPDVCLVDTCMPFVLPDRFYPDFDVEAFRHPASAFADGSGAAGSRS